MTTTTTAATAERYADAKKALGSTFEHLRTSKILVVGAGGIGCELLKNLVLVGCEDIETIDLDTIDISNLNRQFLFRKRHVGQPKAVVAREVVMGFNPNSKVVAYHANVKEARFNIDWFKTFKVVVNALDNVDARRHVNRMCLACDVPLIEAGTTGYLGQVYVVRKGETACYECFPKPTQVVYPICTIRSTPDKPVHCIVWAKELYKLFFGKTEESMLYEPEGEGEEPSAYMAAVKAVRALVVDKPCAAVILREKAGEALKKLCVDELVKQIGMDKYSSSASPPKPLDAEEIRSTFTDEAKRPPSEWRATGWDRKAWNVSECLAELRGVFERAYTVSPAACAKLGTYEFDKDDNMAMFFVAAAANLRSTIFGIKTLSLYDAKGVAGNIIPAIATTNAVVAGLQVAQLIKIVKNMMHTEEKKSLREVCRYTYCLREPTRKGFLLQPTLLEEPQQGCFVCRTARVTVAVDTTTMTLADFVDIVVKKRLGFLKPALDAADSGLYDEEDERLAPNLKKTLAELPAGGVVGGSMLTLTDFATDLEVTLTVKQRDDFDEEKEPEGYAIVSGEDDKADEEQPAEEAEEAPPAKKQRT